MSGEELTGVPSDAAAIIQAAREAAKPAALEPELDGPQAFIVPFGARVEIPDLSAWRNRPMRKRGTYFPATVDALTDYVEQHKTDGTTIWVNGEAAVVEAILNDNETSDAGWRDHRALLKLRPSPEWLYWLGNDQKMLSQEDFSEHLEGGLSEILEPDGAEMLEIAHSFHATSGATFRSAIRLASGEQQLQYDETITAGAGARGDMTVPTRFLLGLAPFIGEDAYKLVARLRFRITGGTLKLGYWLDRPDRARRDALDSIAETIAARLPNVYAGEPAAPETGR